MVVVDSHIELLNIGLHTDTDHLLHEEMLDVALISESHIMVLGDIR